MASVSPSAATESDSKKSVKDLTLVFCRRTKRSSDIGSEGGGGGGSSGDSDDDAKEILLGMKKRGFGEGKWNGFGGKVESGESVEEAAKRELMEEAGVTARELSLRGRLIFHVPSYPSVMRVHVYEAVSFEGEPEESEEMRPRWFRIRDLPLKEMWADDEHWMPLFLEGKSFRGEFHFSDEQTILRHVLEAVTPQEMMQVVLREHGMDAKRQCT
ncbi:conserved unknown protein [Ectocarpus siliculosus]|uniref:Oxidized purine nucleoside triphosphate hydrolase n=1 Tax=Ectocarpus siliculosus TaxID=2880 RepID=D8LFE9_ECTSI|nr:conserved unknown protein [Ectocarpus siliculosus]|eukprot:CBN75609.1 conserved unknown protein [Ectocarpus siliculosus]